MTNVDAAKAAGPLAVLHRVLSEVRSAATRVASGRTVLANPVGAAAIEEPVQLVLPRPVKLFDLRGCPIWRRDTSPTGTTGGITANVRERLAGPQWSEKYE